MNRIIRNSIPLTVALAALGCVGVGLLIASTGSATETKQLGLVEEVKQLVPPGTVVAYAGKAAPPGWELCDGGELNGTAPEYKRLFTAIGTTYGGSGTTFKKPDLRGRTAIGAGQGEGLSDRTLNQKLGAETHQLSIPEMPKHEHPITDPGHSHRGKWWPGAACHPCGGTWGWADPYSWNGTKDGGSPENAVIEITKTGITKTEVSGGNQPHNNMQPSLVLNYIIKL